MLRPLLAALVLCGCAGAPPPPAPAEASPAGTAPAPGATAPVVPIVPAAEVAAWPEPLMILPDGRGVPALNGVSEDVRLVVEAGHLLEPPVGVVRNEGLDWYVHPDGSHSTTTSVPIGGELRGVGMVARPAR